MYYLTDISHGQDLIITNHIPLYAEHTLGIRIVMTTYLYIVKLIFLLYCGFFRS